MYCEFIHFNFKKPCFVEGCFAKIPLAVQPQTRPRDKKRRPTQITPRSLFCCGLIQHQRLRMHPSVFLVCVLVVLVYVSGFHLSSGRKFQVRAAGLIFNCMSTT